MIVVRSAEDAEARLAERTMRCPGCGGVLGKWGHGRTRTVRALGAASVTLRPRRVCCQDCSTTHILLPAALQPRLADTTEVIGVALAHNAHGLGFRRIADLMGRAESTVRRWLRRATPAHLNWAYHQGTARLIQLAPDAFTEIHYTGCQLRHTLTILSAAAYWDRRRCGFSDPAWTLIGMYTRGRLLAPPADAADNHRVSGKFFPEGDITVTEPPVTMPTTASPCRLPRHDDEQPRRTRRHRQ